MIAIEFLLYIFLTKSCERLKTVRKNWDFDRVSKGRGFSGAASAAKQ
jgi:hypothetical protein